MGRKAVSYLLYNLSIALTVLMVIAAVVSWRAGYVSPEKGGFWSTMALLLPVILFINVVVMIWWLIRRKWILAVLPLIALCVNLGYISAMVQMPDYKDAETPHDIRIATLNTNGFRWKNNEELSLTEISSMMEMEHVDVFCMQEFIPSRKLPLKSIREAFAVQMPYFVTEGSIAVASRFPILDYKYVKFPDTNNDYLWADLLIGTDTVRVVSVHLQTSGIAALRHSFRKTYGEEAPVEHMLDVLDKNSKIRAQQVRDIRAMIDATRKPVIVLGDFNDTPSSYTYQTMKGNLTDGFQACGNGYGGTFRPMKGLLRIDYILYDDHFEGRRYYMPRQAVSDHKVVIADLEFRK